MLSKKKIAKSTILYLYKNYYYIVFKDVSIPSELQQAFSSSISEFGSYVYNPDLFIYRLQENGKLILKNNAIKQCLNYFS